MFEDIKNSAQTAILELLDIAKLQQGNVLIIGCSTSEVGGEKIGSASNFELAGVIFDAINPVLKKNGIFLAAQCCEHLNRAVVVEREVAEKLGLEIVNVRPMPKAGGSFAAYAYDNFEQPVVVEFIKADAGLDIGDTFIGMSLKHVAVPVRLSVRQIGQAHLSAARTRKKFIGGERAMYVQEDM
ncbi:MAG: TIGR01440 family protein [bacterium]|nr:TIGR01440 family protein [bacterium]